MTRAKPSIKCAENERLCHYHAHPVGRAGRRNIRVNCGAWSFVVPPVTTCADSLSASAQKCKRISFSLLGKGFLGFGDSSLNCASGTYNRCAQNSKLNVMVTLPQQCIIKRFKRRRCSIERRS